MRTTSQDIALPMRVVGVVDYEVCDALLHKGGENERSFGEGPLIGH